MAEIGRRLLPRAVRRRQPHRPEQQRLERDIQPLAKEVQRALNQTQTATDREELFYQAPTVDGNGNSETGDMESLIGNSEALLRESHS